MSVNIDQWALGLGLRRWASPARLRRGFGVEYWVGRPIETVGGWTIVKERR